MMMMERAIFPKVTYLKKIKNNGKPVEIENILQNITEVSSWNKRIMLYFVNKHVILRLSARHFTLKKTNLVMKV